MRANAALRLALIAAPFAVCALLYAPTLSGAFLSDDYAVLAALSDWASGGKLLPQLLHKFVAGLDAPSNYYRPLSLLSFGASYALWDAEPLGWRVVNLALHLASGALVFAILRGTRRVHAAPRPFAGPAIGAALFLLFPVNPEAVAWISGRYDLLAVFFMLATVLLFQRSTRWNDGYGIAALVAAACALASKESAVLVPVIVTAFAIAAHASSDRPVLRGLRDASPWIVLTLLYFTLRAAIFGNPLQVYPGTSPAASLLHGDWFKVVASMAAWMAALMPAREIRMVFVVATALSVAAGGVWMALRRVAFTAWWPLAATTLLSVVLVLPHLQTLAPNGEQGRLFYTTAALLALTIGMPLVMCERHPARRWSFAIVFGVAIVAVACETVLVRASIAPWVAAGRQARTLLAALPPLALGIPPGGYGFVLVPDHIADVPFGRNAQGGLLSPPAQPAPLTTRVIVQTTDDLPAWPGHIQRGLVTALQRFPLDRVWGEVDSGRAATLAPPVPPTEYFCWGADGEHIVHVTLNAARARADWLGAWRAALAEGRCAVQPGDVRAD